MKAHRLQTEWNRLAGEDPFGAILGRPHQAAARDWEELFASGTDEIRDALRYATTLGLPAARRRALDFGCGAGRLTQALGEFFDEVTGVDISQAMIELARAHNRHPERCRFRLNETVGLPGLDDRSYDFIYSSITLQHIPPTHTRVYLGEFLRLLAPGGLLLFHLPSHRVRPWLFRLFPVRVTSFLSRAGYRLVHPGRPLIEMHASGAERSCAGWRIQAGKCWMSRFATRPERPGSHSVTPSRALVESPARN